MCVLQLSHSKAYRTLYYVVSTIVGKVITSTATAISTAASATDRIMPGALTFNFACSFVT